MSTRPAHYNVKPKQDLSPRQRDVLDLVSRGYTNAQIADRLGIGFESVKTHVSEILGRLGVESREEAAAEWRYYNSLGGRFRRALNSLTSAWTGTAVVAAASVGVIAAGVAAVVFATRGEEAEPPAIPPFVAPTPSALAGWERETDITVGGTPTDITEGFGSIWVSSWETGTVSRIDPATNTVVATIAVETSVMHIRAGAGAVWAASPRMGLVWRIDPATNAVSGTIRVHESMPADVCPGVIFMGVLVEEDGVWVASPGDSEVITHFDPSSLAALEVRPAPPAGECFAPEIRRAGGYLWLWGQDGILQLDPATWQTVREWRGGYPLIEVGGSFWRWLAEGPQEGQFVQFDPVTGQEGRAISVVLEPPADIPASIFPGQGTEIWITGDTCGDPLTVYDLETGEHHSVQTGKPALSTLGRAPFHQGRRGEGHYPAILRGVFAAGSVWLIHECDDTVTRISYNP